MAEPTKTRTQLRRALGLTLEMPFYKRFDTQLDIDAGSTADFIVASELVQGPRWWIGTWYYQTDGNEAGEIRRVTGFQAEWDALVLEYALSGAPSAGESFELTSIFSPNQMHRAINDAIDSGWPAFFEVDMDESLILREDTREYDLSGITNLYKVLKIWIENPTSTQTGTAQSATNNTIVVADGSDLSGVDSNWKVSIYAGTGVGQVRDVSSVTDSTDTVTVGSNWTTNPDSTSKYRLWDPTEQLRDWTKISAVRFDRKKWPDNMYLNERYNSRVGCRFRIQYIKQATELTADTDTTVIPQEYIMNKAMSILLRQRGSDNRTGAKYLNQANEYERLADLYKRDKAWTMPDGTLWQESDPRGRLGGEVEDPLNWGLAGGI